MKMLIKFILFIIILAATIIFIDYVRINFIYVINQNKYTETLDVQGNTAHYVPQGLTYSKTNNVILQTSYNSDGEASMLYVTDFKTGQVLNKLILCDKNGNKSKNHVGGITTDDTTIWITSDYTISEYKLSDILYTSNNYVYSVKDETTPSRGDFCCYNKGILWIGDFFLKPFYPIKDDNPLLYGYKLESENSKTNLIDYSTPDMLISLPKMVQGLAITPDNNFVVTESFTYLINSQVEVFSFKENINKEFYNLDGKKIDYYKFNERNLVKRFKLPPMAEGLFYKNDEKRFYVLFESSSDKYFPSYPKLDKILKIDLNDFENKAN